MWWTLRRAGGGTVRHSTTGGKQEGVDGRRILTLQRDVRGHWPAHPFAAAEHTRSALGLSAGIRRTRPGRAAATRIRAACVWSPLFQRWFDEGPRDHDALLARRGNLPVCGVHVLPHTFRPPLAMRGAPMCAIQELAGHRDLSTTQRYIHLSPSALTHAIRLLERSSALPARGDILETAQA